MVSSQCQVSPGGVLRPTTPRGLIGSHRGVYAFRQFGHGGLASLGLRPSPEPSCAAQEDISRGHIMASHTQSGHTIPSRSRRPCPHGEGRLAARRTSGRMAVRVRNDRFSRPLRTAALPFSPTAPTGLLEPTGSPGTTTAKVARVPRSIGQRVGAIWKHSEPNLQPSNNCSAAPGPPRHKKCWRRRSTGASRGRRRCRSRAACRHRAQGRPACEKGRRGSPAPAPGPTAPRRPKRAMRSAGPKRGLVV